MLSKLLHLKRAIQALDIGKQSQFVQRKKNIVLHSINQSDPDGAKTLASIASCYNQIDEQFTNIEKTLSDYNKLVETKIESWYDHYYEASKNIYQAGVEDSAEYVLQRHKNHTFLQLPEFQDLFLARVGMYNSWKYPAIEIRPGQGQVTEQIKGCDPLYLVDTDNNLFAEVNTKWHKFYQRRLRYYVIEEQSKNPLIDLPDHQFGFIVSFNYFNHKPMHIIENFLKDFYDKLKPGGIAMFTYNNGDLPYGAQNVEKKFCCFTPEHILTELVQNIGFEVVKSYNVLENISWLEIKKPGEIHTIRGGQALAEICSFN